MKATVGKRDFALTLSPIRSGERMNALPKKAGISVKVDGTPVEGRVTTNAAWAASPEYVLSYIWFEVAGKAYYVTLNYAESPADFVGKNFVISEGVGPKPLPRVTKAVERETTRIAGFKRTWTANRSGE